jgi:Bacterial extracellular solute-binding proteins, family 3
VLGVQRGTTSEPVAKRLVAEHRAARVRIYAYDEIEKALGDLPSGRCDAFMKLAPVTEWFVRDRPKLAVVETGIIRERLCISVRRAIRLRDAIDTARAALMADDRVPARQTVARDGSEPTLTGWLHREDRKGMGRGLQGERMQPCPHRLDLSFSRRRPAHRRRTRIIRASRGKNQTTAISAMLIRSC